MPGPLNYTTKVKASTTVAEVQELLAKHGADAIMVNYTDGNPSAVSFRHGGQSFTLPADASAMSRLLQDAAPSSHVSRATMTSTEHAVRVTWRVVKDWLEAQLALVAAQQASLDQVMLPYLVIDSAGRTLREGWQDRLQLTEGSTR